METAIETVDDCAVPELVVEFAETLCEHWREVRSTYIVGSTPADMLYTLLDSFAAVVLGTPEEATT
jgi:hypothetical protein